jgi:hypothetical protein
MTQKWCKNGVKMVENDEKWWENGGKMMKNDEK